MARWIVAHGGGDRRFVALAIAAGPLGAIALCGAAQQAGWALPAPVLDPRLLLWMCGLAPVVEELAFRGALQDALGVAAGEGARWGALSLANVVTSVAFATVHLPTHGPALALGMLLPSLVFGRLKELSPSLLPAIAMHAWYNACYLAVMG